MRSFNSSQIPHPPFSILWPKPEEFKKFALEIGGGNGEFAQKYARKNPDVFLLSLERTKNKSEHFNRFGKTLNNLYFTRADAVNVVAHCVPKNSLDQIFILYPNPYPKKSQANQRWHNMPFMKELFDALKLNGSLELRTNIKSYMDEALDSMPNNFHFTLEDHSVLLSADEAVTAFERKYLERQETCFKATFRKLIAGEHQSHTSSSS